MQEPLSPGQGQTDRLWQAVGEGIALAFRRSDRYEAVREEWGWRVSAGQPWLDFNCALIFGGPDAVAHLTSAATHFRGQSLPFLVCMVRETGEMRAAAQRLGLAHAGPLPLMIRHAAAVDQAAGKVASEASPVSIREAETPEDFRALAELSHQCFGMPIELIEKVMPFEIPQDAAIRTLLALREGELVGGVTFTLQDIGTGLWSMMTRPDMRRQGIAAALLQEVFRQIHALNFKPIFIVSTPDGKPLYERNGFQTIDAGSVWTDRP